MKENKNMSHVRLTSLKGSLLSSTLTLPLCCFIIELTYGPTVVPKDSQDIFLEVLVKMSCQLVG